ncbi:MAG: hypothetical protein SFY66_22360 [Oculatellaceae cyanobacterium bins.114]|nr:hypothetical protein [Oculatellaceae cyanobacterium bins.114]
MFSDFMILASVLGLIQILSALGYFVVSIRQIIFAAQSGRADRTDLRILQITFGPAILLASGIILFLQGWRQDFILILKDILMSILIVYLIILDLKSSYRNPQLPCR